LFYNYYFLFCFDENGIFYIQIGREERCPPKFVLTRAGLYKSWVAGSVGAVVAVCGSGFRNIPCLKLLIDVLF
jgi:hypothetical protein